jgi:hypothetical protein
VTGTYSVINATTCYSCPPGTRGVLNSASVAGPHQFIIKFSQIVTICS